MRKIRRSAAAAAVALGVIGGSALAATPAQAATDVRYQYATQAECMSVKYGGGPHTILSRCAPATVWPGVVIGYVTVVRWY